MKKIFLLLGCIVLLLVNFCGCGNDDEIMRAVNKDTTDISVKVKVPPSNSDLKSNTSTTVNSNKVEKSTPVFSTIKKENVENKIETTTAKPTKNIEENTLAFFDED